MKSLKFHGRYDVARRLILPLPHHVIRLVEAGGWMCEEDFLQCSVGAQRTLKQNSRYWGAIVPAFSEWSGYELYPEAAERFGATPKDTAHNILKTMFLGTAPYTLPNGMVLELPLSTAHLTVEEMSDLQDRAERFLSENNVHIKEIW